MAAIVCRSLATALCFTLALFSDAVERKPGKKEKEAKDAPPVLMSRTGGGNGWADVKELTAAAGKGNPKAQAQLGEMLLRGDTEHRVMQDRARALTLLEQAARAGAASAAFRIGMLLDDGDGVAQDRVRALAYFRAAAAGGVPEAFHNIGAAHAGARGVNRDYVEALAWLIVAKKLGASGDAEAALRSRMLAMRRPERLAAAERRAAEIEPELARSSVAALLPPPAAFAETPPASTAATPRATDKKPTR